MCFDREWYKGATFQETCSMTDWSLLRINMVDLKGQHLCDIIENFHKTKAKEQQT